MRLRILSIVLVAVALLIGATVASARGIRTAKNTSWEQATRLTFGREPVQVYGVLGTTGDARFYVFDATDIGRLAVTLDVPTWAEKKFVPQIVLYQPDTVTAGPVIPVTQPPKTIALVYPPTEPKTHTDRSAWLSVTERLVADVDIPVAGRYYLAVYNAGQLSGRWRLTMTTENDQKFSVWSWPKRWWVTQHWGHKYAIVTYAPLLVVVLVLVAMWVFMYKKRRPAHHRKKL